MRACVVFERLGGFGFALYFLFVSAVSLAVVNMAARLAGSAVADLTFEKSAAKTSRVTTGLEAQERAAGWQSAVIVLETPPVPDVSAAALAKGMDAAEIRALPPDTKSNVGSNFAPKLSQNRLRNRRNIGSTLRPRIAGWMKRINAKRGTTVADESPNSIILRSLRAEM